MFGFFYLKRTADRLRHERMLEARCQQPTEILVHDPIEDDDRYRELLKLVDSEVEQKLAQEERSLGFCHVQWKMKQTILLERFGVLWFSPADLNPGHRID